MPKIKKGLEYFDIATDINNDMRVKLLRAEFGIKGFGIWVQLLIQIYADEGYFMMWDNDTKLLFASDVGETGGLVDEIVRGSVKRGLFNEPVFNQFGVLTSKHIQEKYFRAIKRRASEVDVDARFLVISVDDDIIKDNDNIKLLNVSIKTQSRVEKSKEEKRREEYAHPGIEKMKKSGYKRLFQMNEPLTGEQLDKLKEEFDHKLLQDVFEAMENFKPLLKKNINTNLTARNWLKKRIEDGTNPKKPSRWNGEIDAKQISDGVDRIFESRKAARELIRNAES